MKILLVVDNWKKNGKSVYSELPLSASKFHSGTTFHGEIDLEPSDEEELRVYLEMGYRPVFWVMEDK